MKLLATLLSLFLLVSAALAHGFHTVVIQPQVVKVIKQPVHVIKVVKQAPPLVPVIKYVKTFHSSYGHPFHHHG